PFNNVWRTDGTVQGTSVLMSTLSSHSPVHGLVENDFGVYFFVDLARSVLYKSDGTPLGTHPVASFDRYEPVYPYYGNYDVLSLGDRLVFPARTFNSGQKVWMLCCSDDSLSMIADVTTASLGPAGSHLGSSPYVLGAREGRLLFGADDGVVGWEP